MCASDKFCYSLRSLNICCSLQILKLEEGQFALKKMVKLTMIARVTDGLPLVEGLDDGRDLRDAEFYKQQVKALFKNLSRGQNEASRMSIETGPYVFQYPSLFTFHDCFME